MKVSDKALAVLVALLMSLSAVPFSPPTHASNGPGGVPANLIVQIAPSTLPADGGTYAAVFVSLQDSGGIPSLAVTDTTVFLTAADPSVGNVVNSSMVIPQGQGYAVASFITTPTAGFSTITASATGLNSGSATVVTAIPRGYPTSISVTAVPSEFNSTSSRSGVLVVEFQDEAGLPAKAITDTKVNLYTTNPGIFNLTVSTITLKSGQFVGTLGFTSGFVPGAAFVTATGQNLASGSAQITVLSSTPLALKLYPQPGITVDCQSPVTSCSRPLVVALTDLDGNPAVAPRAITVFIRSSDLSTIVPSQTSVVIPVGSISVTTSFQTTSVPTGLDGTEITASSPNLQSNTVTVFDSTPVVLSGSARGRLSISVGPAIVLANHRDYSSVTVSILDVNGAPAVSSTPLTVALTSSLTEIGNISNSFLVIPANLGYASTVFTSTYVVGTTTLTASANNFESTEFGISTFGPVPSKAVVTSLFPDVPADGSSHQAIEVSLVDTFGRPAVAGTPATVFLTSSQSGIAKVPSSIIVPPGQSAVIANLSTTQAAGVVNITAYVNSLGTGYHSSWVLVTTATPPPASIETFVAPALFAPSPAQKSAVLVFQLQDDSGNPSKARTTTPITATSSDSLVFNETIQAEMAQGSSSVSVLVAPLQSGLTTFTATSPSLSSAGSVLQAYESSFAVQVLASSLTIYTNQTSTLTLTVTIDGVGVQGANVTWSASGGSIQPTIATTDASGRSVAVFRPNGVGVAKVVAVLTSSYAGTLPLESSIIISPVPSSGGGLLSLLFSFPYVLIWVAVAAVAIILVFLFLRRRRRAAEVDESLSEEEQSFNFMRPDTQLGSAMT